MSSTSALRVAGHFAPSVERVRPMVGELDGLARSDGLTGLPNRRPCQELLEHEVAMGRRSKEPLTIALRQAMTELD